MLDGVLLNLTFSNKYLPGFIYIYILQIYWDWIGNGVLITEEAMIISNSHG